MPLAPMAGQPADSTDPEGVPMPVQQPILEAGTEVSRYRVERLVARGGMGLVYRARDIRLDRPVALKLLSPELSDDDRFRERFVRESRLAAAVDHPNVIPVYEADDWQGLLYIAMRFVDGVDLHSVLVASGRMDPATALPVLGQAAQALDAAHRVGLVHRDVKPGNFMLAGATAEHLPPSAHVYLTDFGLTKRASSVSGLTRTGQFLGSLHYVAPEQIRSEEVDARTDVYALACVAFEMFSGRPAFDMEGDAGLLWAHMSVDPPSLTAARPDLPSAVDDVLVRAMAKERADRPDSCGEFAQQLRSALAGTPGFFLPGRAAPTQVSGSADASTAPRGPGDHPSFPPQDQALRSGTDPRGRDETPVQPLAGWGAPVAGWPPPPPGAAPETTRDDQGGPPPWPRPTPPDRGAPPPGESGPPPGAPPFVPAGAPSGGAAPSRRRRTALLVALAVVLALVAAGLFIWRPWGGDLVTRDVLVVPYAVSVPENWEATTETIDDTYTMFGTKDWSGLVSQNVATIADAESDLAESPESLVYLFVDPAEDISPETPAEAAEELTSFLPYGAKLVEQGTREVAGREGLEVGGVVPLGEEGQLRLYAVVVNEEPRMLMMFFSPSSLYEQWQSTFDEIVDSVEYTG